jgi:hypothetical protein
VLAEVTAREIGRVTIAEALEPRWLCLYLEEHEKTTLENVEQMVSNLRALTTPEDHTSALAILRKVARRG